MELITSLLNNPEFSSVANTQVFVAVLLALLVYRVLAPIVDLFNPFIILLKVIDAAKRTMAARKVRSTAATNNLRGGSGRTLVESYFAYKDRLNKPLLATTADGIAAASISAPAERGQ